MIGNIGPLEIGILLVVALLIFGPKKLPELGKGAGQSIREFKESVTGERTTGDDSPRRAMRQAADDSQSSPS
jgi:sec-independent protein translocase protein TatA